MYKITGSYKYCIKCIVPKCINNSVTTPNKRFFPVPKDEKLRKNWFTAMKRCDKIPLSYNLYCCEEHFDVETEAKNFLRCRFVGGRMFLKSGVLPHKFECQKNVKQEIKSRPVRQTKNKAIQVSVQVKRIDKACQTKKTIIKRDDRKNASENTTNSSTSTHSTDSISSHSDSSDQNSDSDA